MSSSILVERLVNDDAFYKVTSIAIQNAIPAEFEGHNLEARP